MEALFLILTNTLFIIHCLVKTWNLACCIPHPRGRTPCRVGEKQFLPILALLWSWLCLTCLSTQAAQGFFWQSGYCLHSAGERPRREQVVQVLLWVSKNGYDCKSYTEDVFRRTVLVRGKLVRGKWQDKSWLRDQFLAEVGVLLSWIELSS